MARPSAPSLPTRRRLIIAALAALVVILPISAYFVATQPITPRMALGSSISVILFALPSYYAVVRLHGRKRGLALLAALGAYALAIESSALATGFPYGDFTYTDLLGNKVLGLTPWTVAFAYPPILLLAFVAARRAMPGEATVRTMLKTAVMTALFATAIDLVLDPAAVRLGFWYWDSPGPYYGVPFINFAGWLLTGFIGGLILHRLWRGAGPVAKPMIAPPAVAYSGLAVLWFWTAVNAWLGQWLPAAIGLLLTIFFVRLLRRGASGRPAGS